MPRKLLDVYAYRHLADNFLYRLMGERRAETNISHVALPTYPEHVEFIESRPYRAWYLITGNTVFGYVAVSKRNEIGVVIMAGHRREGHARWALTEVLARMTPKKAKPGKRRGGWLANINPDNEASIALFTSLGFVHIQNTYALDTP